MAFYVRMQRPEDGDIPSGRPARPRPGGLCPSLKDWEEDGRVRKMPEPEPEQEPEPEPAVSQPRQGRHLRSAGVLLAFLPRMQRLRSRYSRGRAGDAGTHAAGRVARGVWVTSGGAGGSGRGGPTVPWLYLLFGVNLSSRNCPLT